MTETAKPSPLIELLVTLVIPSLILMKLSGPENLGAVQALLLALAFPLFWGARDLWRRRKLNLFATLGLVSVLLTGGIGLLQLDTRWLAVKEAAIPGLIGLAVAISALTRYPLIGSAGVSAVPMAARVSNKVGQEYDRSNFLLMHAMGPNVAGVIGSAVAAGVLLSFF